MWMPKKLYRLYQQVPFTENKHKNKRQKTFGWFQLHSRCVHPRCYWLSPMDPPVEIPPLHPLASRWWPSRGKHLFGYRCCRLWLQSRVPTHDRITTGHSRLRLETALSDLAPALSDLAPVNFIGRIRPGPPLKNQILSVILFVFWRESSTKQRKLRW